MSTHIFLHASREPGAIKADHPDVDDCYGGPLHLRVVGESGGMPDHVTIYTGSAALADALAEAINGVMAKFAKPAAAKPAEEAAE